MTKLGFFGELSYKENKINTMRLICSPVYCLFLSALVLSLLQSSALAAQTKSYIVYMGSAPGNGDPLLAAKAVTSSHVNVLSSVLQSVKNRIVRVDDIMQYSYNKVFNGFAVVLTEEEAKELAKHPDVISIFESQLRQLHTTRSWEFLGLERNGVVPNFSAWEKAKFGEDVIIANIDTGVWPESKSFTDEGYGPVPAKFKGICQNDHDPRFHCNRKLIGARYFYKGFEELLHREFNMDFNYTKSPQDVEGHGTHTLATAGGDAVPGVSINGLGNGTARGGSPRARVAAYKVCWPSNLPNLGGCSDADILAGLEAAIDDNVDVISMSLGGRPLDYFKDAVSLGSFHAVMKGISFVASAGNSGPDVGTVSNISPWIFTVGASTIDRQFVTHVTLGNKNILKGAGASNMALPSNKFYPLVTGVAAALPRVNSTAAGYCLRSTLDPRKMVGKILVCLRAKEGDETEKYDQAKKFGAVGLILVNTKEYGIDIKPSHYSLPASHLTFSDGQTLFSYLNSSKAPVATISAASTNLGVKPAPFMTDFTSRGPNSITPSILKPDITAPGVGIIAAVSEAEESGNTGPYGIMDGTSMSCPHVAGVVGLLKTIHPHWSPSEIKSAIMTTATTLDNTGKPMLDFTNIEATPFDYGAGHVRPNKAIAPGLVYPMDQSDYVNFLCAIGYEGDVIEKFFGKSYHCPAAVSVTNLNYPTITIPGLCGNATVTRRVKNVGCPNTSYSATVKAPSGVSITVEPKTLNFTRYGQELTYKLTFTVETRHLPKDYSFGYLVWSNGRKHVRSPIVVKAECYETY